MEQVIRYVGTGHFFYVTGCIPDKKPAASIDEKLLQRFEIAMPRWQRSRRKRSGIASVHYLRFESFFILLATHGHHRFYEEHTQEQIQDCRRIGIKFEGYSIRHGYSTHTSKWHTLVRLDSETYKNLTAYMLDHAKRRSKEYLEDLFRSVWFQPYRPVREQLLAILRKVNRERKQVGFEQLDWKLAIPTKRKTRRVFRKGE